MLWNLCIFLAFLLLPLFPYLICFVQQWTFSSVNDYAQFVKLFYFGMQKKQGKLKVSPRFKRFCESNYMNPNQGLCLGALFDIAATNVKLVLLNSFFLLKISFSHNGNLLMNFPGAWRGQETLHTWFLPFCRDVEWCRGRHCSGAWWGGKSTYVPSLFLFFKLRSVYWPFWLVTW